MTCTERTAWYRIAAHALGVNKNEALVEGNPEVSQLCYAIKEYAG